MLQAVPDSCWNPPCRQGGGLAQPRLGRVPNMLVQACPQALVGPQIPQQPGKGTASFHQGGKQGMGRERADTHRVELTDSTPNR